MLFRQRTINRAILGELLIAFLLSLFTFNFILVTERVLRMTKVFSSVGASLSDMLKIVLWLQPQISVLTIPIAFFMAVLLTYGRMGADNELVVLRSGGMSLTAMSRPLFALGIACFLLSALASLFAAPAGARNLRQSIANIIITRAPLAIEEGIFNTAFSEVVIYVDKKISQDSLHDVFIHDSRSGEPLVLTARSGRLEPSDGGRIAFDLEEGSIHLLREGGITTISFDRYRLSLPLAFETSLASLEELTPARLLVKARTSDTMASRARVLLEFHRRFSLPVLCLVLMVLGPPLSLMAGRTGRMGGLVLGIVVFSIYYAFLIYTEGLARSGALPVVTGAWAPNLVLFTFALIMFRRAAGR